MCLDIPPLANDILKITREILSLAESILYFSYSLAKKLTYLVVVKQLLQITKNIG